MLLSTLTAILLPARLAGVVMCEPAAARTWKLSGLHAVPSTRILNCFPAACAWKNET